MEDTKFKIKAFLYYLVLEPWTSKVSIPNLRTISWLLIFIAIFVKSTIFSIITLLLGVIFYCIYEYKQGNFIYWYRNKKGYGDYKKIIRESKNGI